MCSSNDTLPEAAPATIGVPPGLSMPQAKIPVQDLPEDADYSAEVSFRGMAEPQQEQDGWSMQKNDWFTNDV
jgi:hypothetical protein